MKRILQFILSMFLAQTLSAQITIHSSDMPNAGDSVYVGITNTIGALDASLTGTNYSWDYSSLTATSHRYEKFDSPLTFPSFYSLLFNIFNTSYGKENRTLTTLPIPGVTFSAAYDFLKESNAQLKQVGAGYIINGTPLPFLYTSADVIYRFPMNYSNIDSSDYQFGLPIPTLGYYGETGHRVNVVDGWGTLQTPSGTYQTLRIKSVISSTDTLYISALSFGSNIPRPKRVEYKWFATGKKLPVLELDGTITGTSIITNVEFLDTPITPAGVKNLDTSEMNAILFPNPADNFTSLYYYNDYSGSINISISDLVGRNIGVIKNEYESVGVHCIEINTENLKLKSGIYLISLTKETTKKTIKLVISK